MVMKKTATMAIIAMALLLLIGIVGSAYSEGTTTPAKTCATSCPKFVDNNKDGVCDSMSVCHKDGKCQNMANCKKDMKCSGKCKAHAAAGTTCDPTKCATMPNGCPGMAKGGCPGHK
jgi:hypothetical protein